MSTPPPPPSAAPTSPGAGATGIEITAKFFPLAFILNFFKPTIVINGTAQKGTWRTPLLYPTGPGQFTVQVHFAYLFIPTAGKAVTTVTVAPGQIVHLAYKAPWLVFLAGKLTAS